MSRKSFSEIITAASVGLTPRSTVVDLGLGKPGVDYAKTPAFGVVAFEEDYKHLNKLRFYQQACETRTSAPTVDAYELGERQKRLSEVTSYFRRIIEEGPKTKWQTAAIAAYETECQKRPRTKTVDDFIAFVNHKERAGFPARYVQPEEILSAAERNFPSADISAGKDLYEFAHLQKNYRDPEVGGILASHVPHLGVGTGATEANEAAGQRFLEMIDRRNVTCVVALGGKADRFNYREHHTGQYQTNAQKVDISHENILLTDKKSGLQKPFLAIGFSVSDQSSLNLSNEELSAVLEIHALRKKGLVLIHCDSGVGRTGQLILLLKTLEAYEIDPRFRTICNHLGQLLLAKSHETETISALVKEMMHELVAQLCHLRKARYSVETETQFLGAVPQLVLLLGKMHGLSDDALNTLRSQMDVAPPAVLAEKTTLAVPVSVLEETGKDSEEEEEIDTPVKEKRGGFLTEAEANKLLDEEELNAAENEGLPALPPQDVTAGLSSRFKFGSSQRGGLSREPSSSSSSGAGSDLEEDDKVKPK